jgi:thioredoxin reductase (NADPH)
MYDIIIVGGGVAAFSAALYAGRQGYKTLILTKDIGGQANYTDLIENYPGITKIGGFDLVQKIKVQAENYEVETIQAEVSKIKSANDEFVVTAYGKQYKSSAVILASGKTPQDLGVLGEEELKGKGVSYCALCDMPLYKKKIVTVVGVGNLNLEAALLGAKFAKKVYILSKTDKLSGHPALLKAVKNHKKIELISYTKVLEIIGLDKVEAIRLQDLNTKKETTLTIDGVFIELGYIVKSDYLTGLLQLNREGQIIITPDQSTSTPGIFACGDATDRVHNQAVISAGDGAAAALSAHEYLLKQQGEQSAGSDWTEVKNIKR